MRIKIVSPLVDGEPLLLLPSCELIRWTLGDPLPLENSPYLGKTISLTPEQKQKLYALLRAPTQIDRCEAAAALPIPLVLCFFSYPQARNMIRVAKRLAPNVKEHLRTRGASLFWLIYVAKATTEHEQIERWNARINRQR